MSLSRWEHERRARFKPDGDNAKALADWAHSKAWLELKDFNPDEPRDPHTGEWTGGGGGLAREHADLIRGALGHVPAGSMTSEQRQQVLRHAHKQERSKLKPNVVGLEGSDGSPRISGQQAAYAKGRARKRASAAIDAHDRAVRGSAA